MSPESFETWLAVMKVRKLGKTYKACADLLGVTTQAIRDMRKRGTDRRTALACRALLHELEPYS